MIKITKVMKKNRIPITCGFLMLSSFAQIVRAQERPNILLVVADDMEYSSVGAFGCQVKNITPNIDRLAENGIRFTNGYVNVAVSQPSRGVMMTGLYGHQSGIEGFQHYTGDKLTLTEQLRNAGYETAMLGKLAHSMPKYNTELKKFYIAKDLDDLGMGRDPQLYYKYCNQFFEHVKAVSKPFFFMVNSRDPHRPFAGSGQEMSYQPFVKFFKSGKNYPSPSKIYTPGEITVPGFLPDIKDVRTEVAQYFSSVKRCDDMVGMVMKSLKENGLDKNTLIIFLSDNGMAFPFAKTNCYLASTKTPMIAVWPGKIKPNSIDSTHIVSEIDFYPTFLDAAQIKEPNYLEGRSLMQLFKGNKQKGWDDVYTQFYETARKTRYPMRAIEDKEYVYIFSPWSDGDQQFQNESMAGLTFKAMKKEAQKSPSIAHRVDFFLNRDIEEFYDLKKDPNALNNLINDPQYQKIIEKYRQMLKNKMGKTKDPALEAFDNRYDKGKVRAWLEKDKESATASEKNIPINLKGEGDD